MQGKKVKKKKPMDCQKYQIFGYYDRTDQNQIYHMQCNKDTDRRKANNREFSLTQKSAFFSKKEKKI